jgi:hypothetical protein
MPGAAAVRGLLADRSQDDVREELAVATIDYPYPYAGLVVAKFRAMKLLFFMLHSDVEARRGNDMRDEIPKATDGRTFAMAVTALWECGVVTMRQATL